MRHLWLSRQKEEEEELPVPDVTSEEENDFG